MKRKEETILLLLFCGGIIGGLLLPRWTFVNLNLEAGCLALDAFRQYAGANIDYSVVLRKVTVSRLSTMFLLYFSCYCAAGFWILAGTCAVVGMSMGFLAAMAVLQMKYWGILFCCCALFPQWIFYGWAGQKIVRFMERRKRRTLLCNGNPAPAYSRKVFLDFLALLGLSIMGIISEVYLNSQVLRYFLQVYTVQK